MAVRREGDPGIGGPGIWALRALVRFGNVKVVQVVAAVRAVAAGIAARPAVGEAVLLPDRDQVVRRRSGLTSIQGSTSEFR